MGKKKKFDPNDASTFDHRLDSLSSYLFNTDSTGPASYGSMPSVTLESTQSPSDGSSHSSSIYSPRSASGSVKSPVETALDLSKTDIDDINNLLFSFGAPYDNPTVQLSKDPITWPHSAPMPSQNATNAMQQPQQNGSSPYDYNYQQQQNLQNGHHDGQRNAANAALYPSLANLGPAKPIKPLPQHSQHKSQHSGEHNQSKRPSYTPANPSQQALQFPNGGNGMYASAQTMPQQGLPMNGHGQAPNMPSVSFDYLAPQRSIAAEHVRDPAMQSIQLLSRAPPRSSALRSVRDRTEERTRESGDRNTKQGVSSLRSTAMEDDESDEREMISSQDRFESPESMSTSEDSDHGNGEACTDAWRASYPRTSSIVRDDTEEGDNTLAPIDGSRVAEMRGSECHLPSLRSLLSNPTSDSASQATRSPSHYSDSPRSPPQSYQHASHKRSTPSRQFYPPLSSLASHGVATGSSSASSSTGHRDGHDRRPSTGERMDRIVNGVGNFRMSSMDDHVEQDHHRHVSASATASEHEYEDSGCKSESDDDTSVDAVYKRSRLRTRSPSPMHSTPLVTDESDEEDELASARYSLAALREEESEEDHAAEALRRRRLAVIQALVARANELFRDNLQKKLSSARSSHPALIRVKEEEME